jgi:uncharacterized protein YuzE
MRLEFDLDVGALYIELTDSPVARTVEFGDNANVDLDARDGLVGIEVLSAAHSWPLQAILSRFTIEKADAAQLRAYFTTEVPVTGRQVAVDDLPLAGTVPVMKAEPTAPTRVLEPA